MGVLSFLKYRFVEFIVVVALVLFLPYIPPNTTFTSYKLNPAPKLEGKLALNDRLNGVEHLYENEIKGPESFAEYNNELYASLGDGKIVKFINDRIIPVTNIGRPCSGDTEPGKCGRPLGLRITKDGFIYVVDTYRGIWKINIKNGEKILLISKEQEIEGKKPGIPNTLDVSENGDIYWTDSSTDFNLEDGIYTALGDGKGRFIHYNAKTRTNTVLLDNLLFSNGVVLSPDEDFVLISETMGARVLRYYLKGPKKGTHDIFLESLPGLPDNLNKDGKDGFLIALYTTVDKDHPFIGHVISPFPWIRKFFARCLGLVELGFYSIQNVYPNVYSQTALHWIGHFESVAWLTPKRSVVLHVSKSGEILNCLHSTDGSLSSTSEAFLFGDHLYFGSPHNTFVGRKSLSEIGLEYLARKKRDVPPSTTTSKPAQAPTTTQKPTQAPKTTPKPTQAPTTTPKPTQVPKTTQKPTQAPTTTPKPTQAPTTTPKPTQAPTTTPKPTQTPTTTKKPTTSIPKTKESEKAMPKVATVKETVPKTESVKPKN